MKLSQIGFTIFFFLLSCKSNATLSKSQSTKIKEVVQIEYTNGQVKETDCGTNYAGLLTGGAPVGLHSYYDPLGNLSKTIFYYIDDIHKSYK